MCVVLSVSPKTGQIKNKIQNDPLLMRAPSHRMCPKDRAPLTDGLLFGERKCTHEGSHVQIKAKFDMGTKGLEKEQTWNKQTLQSTTLVLLVP